MNDRKKDDAENDVLATDARNRGLAHELNNVLMPVIMNAEMALEDLPSGHPARRPIEKILRSAHRGKELIDEISKSLRHEGRQHKSSE